MSLDDPEVAAGLFFAGTSSAPPADPVAVNVSDIFSGLTGLSSIAGGFDHAYIDDATGSVTDSTDSLGDFNWATSGNFSDIGRNFLMATDKNRFECGHFTKVGSKYVFTMDVTAECRFWSEGVFSSFVAAFGLLGNLVSMWVLSVPEMRNSFNRLLLALAIIDTMFILPGIVIYTAKAFTWKADWYNYAFPVFLYPFSEIALCSSIYMTVAIAVERYIGLCRPLKRLTNGRGPTATAAYILPVLLLAFVLNIPKFFESETAMVNMTTGGASSVNASLTTRVKITPLRYNPYYITYYWMLTRLLATGIIPLAALAVLNSLIYMSIRQSKQQLRILAIRSALPMAILGQSAPTVPPLSELVPGKNEHCCANTSTSTSTSSSNNGHKKSKRLTMQNHNDLDKVDEEAGADAIGCVPESPKRLDKCKCNPHHHNEYQVVNREKHLNGKPGMVQGRLRQIQRSISAFTTPSTSDSSSSSFLAKRNSDAKITRMNSNASNVTTATTAAAAPPASSWTPVSADMKLAPILFGVVIVFVLCNSLRVALNIYDFSVVDEIIQCETKGGVGRMPPAWVVCSVSVSHFLLMVNSSVNFLVYCVAGTKFRRILMRKVRVGVKSLRNLACCCGHAKTGNKAGEINEADKAQSNKLACNRILAQRRSDRLDKRLTVDLLRRDKNKDILEEEEDLEEDVQDPGDNDKGRLFNVVVVQNGKAKSLIRHAEDEDNDDLEADDAGV